MKCQWTGKKVDLQSLAKEAEHFFRQRKFNTGLDESTDLKVLRAVLREEDQVKTVILKISGSPDDFVVDFSAGEHSRSLLKFGSLLSLFGGGALLLKSHKEVEFYQELEQELWNYLDEVVARFTGSAKSSFSHSKFRIQNIIQSISNQNESDS